MKLVQHLNIHEMENNRDWTKDILNIITKIQRDFPELSKYINEMPVKTTGKEGVNSENLEEYYHSLVEMQGEYAKTHEITKKESQKVIFPGYPQYPPSEDIYKKGKKESNINPDDLSKRKAPIIEKRKLKEKGLELDRTGYDLDVPGAELDDEQENIGSEDEENNYYSLGGDNHHDLDED